MAIGKKTAYADSVLAVEKTEGIAEFIGEFGREDQNALAAKVNELVRAVNNLLTK